MRCHPPDKLKVPVTVEKTDLAFLPSFPGFQRVKGAAVLNDLVGAKHIDREKAPLRLEPLRNLVGPVEIHVLELSRNPPEGKPTKPKELDKNE